MTRLSTDPEAPGHGLDYDKMPGHWLLAQLGKKVLRPGGVELTRRMLESLNIRSTDEVVEFAPGLGATARMALERDPASYTGIERDETAARRVRWCLRGSDRQCLVGRAEHTGLPGASATVVFGEAMLTMQTPTHKAAIVTEAARLLRTGGRYGVHELCLQPDDLEEAKKSEISLVLSDAIRVGASPLTPGEWEALLEDHGFTVETRVTAPMHLLEPGRFIQDEGWARTVRFVLNVVRTPAARRRILRMRNVFRNYADNLGAITMVGVKK